MIARKIWTGLATAALAWTMAATAAQAENVYRIDPAKSEVHFTLVDVLHTVHGTFRLQPSEITFAPDGNAMGGMIVVDARSGVSGNSIRDHRMTDEELKAPSFSTVTFAPRRFKGTLPASGDGKIEVVGMFTILGSSHEITVPMQVHVEGTQCKAVGSFPVPYVAWGLKDPSTLMIKVEKQVAIDLVLAGQLQSKE
ncbi:MAG: YceI family protein [Acidobacteriota bacterium]|nr:YceI family protein [Acidobacteriota bacterium]